jgi:deoxyribose-phosphate aldolase
MEDLKLMVDNVGEGIQVKAAGGVRDYETLKQVHELGVSRCGASRTQTMMDEAREALGLPAIEFKASGSAASGY